MLQLLRDCDNESRLMAEENARQSSELESMSKRVETAEQQMEESGKRVERSEAQLAGVRKRLEESEAQLVQARVCLKEAEQQRIDSDKQSEAAIARIAMLERMGSSESPMSYERAGSLAEAMLQVHGVAAAAQQAADEYIIRVKKAEEDKLVAAERVLEDARRKAALLVSEAMAGTEQIQRARATILQTLRREVDQMLSGSRDEMEERFAAVASKIVTGEYEEVRGSLVNDVQTGSCEQESSAVSKFAPNVQIVSETVRASLPSEQVIPQEERQSRLDEKAVSEVNQIHTESRYAVQADGVGDLSALLSVLSQDSKTVGDASPEETAQSVNAYVNLMSDGLSAELGTELRKVLDDLANK